MKLLPVENITYKTRLKEDELIRRLKVIVEPEETSGFGTYNYGNRKKYVGEIKGLTFSINRIIYYRNSFLPQIHGSIEKDHEGSVVKVKMNLNVFVFAFLCFCFVAAAIAFIMFLSVASTSSFLKPAPFISFGVLIFLYLMTMGGFKFESRKAKNDLRTIFEAEISEQ